MSKTISELSIEQYEHDWKPIHDQLYTGRCHTAGAFRNTSWRSVILVGELPDQDQAAARAMLETIKGEGATTLVGIDREQLDPSRFRAFVAPATEAGIRALSSELHDPSDGHIFSNVTTWGLVYNPPDSIYIFSAASGVLQNFIDKVGGEALLYERFIGFVRAWPSNDATAEYRKSLLTLANWSSPPTR